MSTDPGLAAGYHPYLASKTHLLNQRATVRFRRERGPVPSGTTVWPNLPERCFGQDRQLPAWLLQPWQLLQEAAQRNRPLSERLVDLMQVGQTLDDLFVKYLPVEAAWFASDEAAGLSIDEHIPRWVDELIGEATRLYMHQLRPELVAEGIFVRSVPQLDEWQREWLHGYFMERVYPLLTPLAVDPGRPFPYISSDSLNLLVELTRVDGPRNNLFARVKIPRSSSRLVAVPSHPEHGPVSSFAPTIFVCSADVVRYFVRHLFPGMPVRHVYLFRLVRGDHALPGTSTAQAKRLRRMEDTPVVRLDVEQRMGAPVLDWLMEHVRLPRYALAQHDRLLDWSCLPDLVARVEAREFKARENGHS